MMIFVCVAGVMYSGENVVQILHHILEYIDIERTIDSVPKYHLLDST